jgi:hypothetical protein
MSTAKIAVIAGTRRQFDDWCRDHADKAPRAVFAYDEQTLRGLEIEAVVSIAHWTWREDQYRALRMAHSRIGF